MANIKVFARLKPCQGVNQELIRREDQAIYIYPPGQVSPNASTSSGCIKNLQESKPLSFRFVHVFGMKSSQKNVFDVAAKDIVKQFLEGYNGTIFAYGQTGAGKTYTIQGEGVDSSDGSDYTGLIPQSLSLIFQDVARNHHETVNIHVSFLEIYKETAYDLLGPILFRGSKTPKELSKVLVTMGGNESCHLYGLSYHCVTSVEEATKLYILGVANRMTAETPDNQRSFRSHAVFSIMIFRQKHGTEIFVRSKLNLVDLAGSERVSKASAVEQELGEAKYVNVSLHHLESVIIALQKFDVKSLRNCSRKKQTGESSNRCSSATLQGTSVDGTCRPRLIARLRSASAVELGNGKHAVLAADYEPVHVPYRNSLLTMVLQDSLGGNCNTAMVAALSAEEKNVCETISTCRFAQRVARIQNKPMRNEEVDKNMVIRRLQRKLAKLHLELANYKHDSITLRSDDDSIVEDKHECIGVMRSFLAGRINDPVAHGINTPRKFRTSLRYLRRRVVESSSQDTSDGDQGLQSSDDRDSGVPTSSEPTSPLNSEVENDVPLVSNFIAQLPSAARDMADSSQHRWSVTTHESGISSSTEREEPTPDKPLSGASREMPQPPGPGISEVSTQTVQLKTCEERETGHDVCLGEGSVQPAGTGHENVLICELELQKETLLNKSKMFTSRLAEQRARLVVMLRRGDLPEELQNEKIVELHLQKKQREVENKLSFVIKKLADLKYTDRLKQVQTTEQQQAGTQTLKEMELKEMSTRQKLLSRREQMRNLIGFSRPTASHQAALSTSSRRSGTSHSSLSRTPSMPSYWEDGGRDNRTQYRSGTSSPIMSVSSSKCKTTFAKPAASEGRLCDTLPQIGNVKSSSESSFSRRGFSSQGRNKRGTLRNVDKNCPVAHYMNNSHQTLYHKSTFPCRIENGACSDVHGTKIAQGIIPKRHKACTSSESKFARNSSGGCLQLKNQSSDPGKVESDTIKPSTREKSVTESDAIEYQTERSKQENKCSHQFETIHLPSPGQKATNIQGHSIPSATCLNREQRQRVLRIRQLVNAAEVIQRTWRLYKRNKNGNCDIK